MGSILQDAEHGVGAEVLHMERRGLWKCFENTVGNSVGFSVPINWHVC